MKAFVTSLNLYGVFSMIKFYTCDFQIRWREWVGDHGDTWHRLQLPHTQAPGWYQPVFDAVCGNGPQGYIALDDFVAMHQTCLPAGELNPSVPSDNLRVQSITIFREKFHHIVDVYKSSLTCKKFHNLAHMCNLVCNL